VAGWRETVSMRGERKRKREEEEARKRMSSSATPN